TQTPLKHRRLVGLCPGARRDLPRHAGAHHSCRQPSPFVLIPYSSRQESTRRKRLQAARHCEGYLRSVTAPKRAVAERVDRRQGLCVDVAASVALKRGGQLWVFTLGV